MTSVDQIANAVLYEGYILYPYRPSAVKNKQRWNFGLVYPRNCSAGPSTMQTECLVKCLVKGSASTQLRIRVRFLQVVRRQVAQPNSHFVAAMEIDGEIFQSWQEAMEREIVLPCYRTSDTVVPTLKQAFRFAPRSRIQTLKNRDGRIAGFIHRENRLLEGAIDVAAIEVSTGVHRITVTVSNLTECDEAEHLDHDSAMLYSMISAHTILVVTGGAFVSLLDPPEHLREAAAGCNNVGTWPVLAGEKGQYNSMLSSPIILYDYPEIAPESPGELFDGTEIDEILTLRIMTMTDQEKDEMRRSDERARRLLERTESLPPEQLAKLHGALRRHL